jgi:hypothetical protein
MTDRHLHVEMKKAWEDRGEDLADILTAAHQAPALFSEDYIAGVRADFLKAVESYQVWSA